jgi:DNA polymerase III delta prime subunit
VRPTGFAISGKAGSGKTTFAEALIRVLLKQERFGIRLSLADALKDYVKREYGLEKSDQGGREKLIEVGIEKRREDPLYWVNALMPRIAAAQASGRTPVIDDCRFQNELAAFRGMGFYTIRIDCPQSIRAERLVKLGLDVSVVPSIHPSEVELDHASFDFRFQNIHAHLPAFADACLMSAGLKAA